MNAQPYKVIVVRTPEDKMKLSKYMLLNNAKFVNSASATLIVCCDLGIPLSHSHEITEMEKANGASEEEASMAERVRTVGGFSLPCSSVFLQKGVLLLPSQGGCHGNLLQG